MISPVSAGGGFTRTGICTVVDMGSLEIEIDVNESYINRVEPGQPVEATLDAYPDWKIPCQGHRDHPDGRPRQVHRQGARRLRQARPAHPAGDEREGGVPRGGGAGPAPRSRTVLVPKAAVQQQDGRDVVLVVQGGRAERRAVTVSSAQRQRERRSAPGLAAGRAGRGGPAQGLAGRSRA